MKDTFSVLAAACALLLLPNCSGSSDDGAKEPARQETVSQSFEERTKREIEVKMQLPATEKYTYRIYREYINSDTLRDAIITINRLNFAIDEAIRTNRTAKAAEVGYMGNYNFFIYYDGALDKYSVPIPVPSTPGRPLDVSFESITSPIRKDVLIDYRIRNSGWRAYFTVLNESDLTLIFRWEVFDHAGTAEPVALYHALEEHTVNGAKDIVIYEGELVNNSTTIKDIYAFEPEIRKKNKVEMHFVYEPRAGKYRLKE